MEEPKKGIGLLGGSFNPVHNGHLSIARSFLRSKYISELWILLAPDPPHKTNRELSDYKIRLKMLQSAFAEVGDVRINEIENQLSYPSFTVQTVSYLHKKFSDYNFFLCIGEDSAVNFARWHKWQKILTYCELLVAARPNVDNAKLDKSVTEKAHFINHQAVEFSSTKIRKRVMSGKNISSMVPSSVDEIIEKYHLYKK